MNESIIVLGGMGPQASLELHRLLNEGSCRFHDGANEDFPRILHASIPVPDFISSTENFRQAVKIVENVCEGLPLKNATAIGLACNTAHLMVDMLPLSDTNFVSMIEAVADQLKKMGVRKIGLLASPQTINSQLYLKAISARDIEVLVLSEKKTQDTEHIIRQVVAGLDPLCFRSKLTSQADELVEQGAEVILLGCTELPLVGVDVDVPVVSSLGILADALLEKHYRCHV